MVVAVWWIAVWLIAVWSIAVWWISTLVDLSLVLNFVVVWLIMVAVC